MASGPSPIHFSLSPTQNTVRIPFEYSRIMDECRVEVLKKYKKDIIEQVRFSDVSSTLIACGLVSKDECFEVCKLSVKKQMAQCFQKVHDIMDILVCQQKGSMKKKASESSGERTFFEDKQNGLVKNIWDNFLLSLKKEHVSLAVKMENELYKCAESKLLLKRSKKTLGSGSLKVKKEDIGTPTDFQHVKHYGLKATSPTQTESDGRVLLQHSNSMNSSKLDSLEILDENDPDLKEFFKRAGVLERHLVNDMTKQIIINFIAEHGGMESIRQEVRQRSPHPIKEIEQENKSFFREENNSNSPREETKNEEVNRTSFDFTNNNFYGESRLEELGKERQQTQKQPDPPATVPFEPTPKPVSNLYYF